MLCFQTYVQAYDHYERRGYKNPHRVIRELIAQGLVSIGANGEGVQ